MKGFKYYAPLIIILAIRVSIVAQTNTPYLSVGDKIPNVEFKMINYHKAKLKLSDFKGKAMILDFWSTWCTVCIKQFPKMEKLQQKFKNNLEILLVTAYRDSIHNKRFFEEMERKKNKINLPSAVEDTSLLKLFPTAGLPLEVWIDKNGVIKAITDHSAVTDENISKFLSGIELNLPFVGYKDNRYKTDDPLLINGNGGPENSFLFRSIFTSYKHGLKNTRNPLTIMDDSGKIIRITLINQSLFQFYKIISKKNYGSNDFLSDAYTKRLIIDSKNALRYRDWPMLATLKYDTIYKFMTDNLFCYELILPSTFSEAEAFTQLEKDVNTFFKTKLSIEKRKIRCLSLIRTAQSDSTLFTPIKAEKEMSNLREMFYYNIPIDRFINHINEFIKIPFVINNTGISNRISIEVSLPLPYTIQDIRAQLKKYKLDLVEIETELDMMVLKEL